ncbi:Uncharacterised protein [Mycobacteroides abscessus subsp. abscessus]|nr:Uncharacterised protein [Mycobacteroides abscessus subsp. abscessus]
MVQQCVDGLLVAVHHLEHAVGKTCLREQFGETHRDRRVTLTRLEDEGVAACECRPGLPQRDHGREVERGDARDHAEGLADRVHVDARAGTLGELTLDQMRYADGEFDDLDAALDVTEGVGVRLAVFERERRRDLVGVLIDKVDEAHQHAGAALRVPRGPLLLRFDGGCDSGGDVVGAREGNGGLDRAGAGVEDVGVASVCHLDARTVEVVRNGRYGYISGHR